MSSVDFEQFANAMFKGHAFQEGAFQLENGQTVSRYWHTPNLESHPRHKRTVVAAVLDIFDTLEFDRLAAVPDSINGIAVSVCDSKEIPRLVIPKVPKSHGYVTELIGHYRRGDRVVLFDDVLNTGSSAYKAIAILEARKLKVEHVVALIETENGGAREVLAGRQVHAVATHGRLMDYHQAHPTK